MTVLMGYSVPDTLTNDDGEAEKNRTVTVVLGDYSGTAVSDPTTGILRLGPLPLGFYTVTFGSRSTVLPVFPDPADLQVAYDAALAAAPATDLTATAAALNAAIDAEAAFRAAAVADEQDRAEAAEAARQLLSEKGQPSGYASLDGGGTVPDAQIPFGIARDSDTATAVAAEAARALAAEALLLPKAGGTLTGDVAANGHRVTGLADPALAQDADTKSARDTAVATEATARAAADALLIPLAQRAAANGVATLDSTGVIPTAQIPALALTTSVVVASQAAMLALTTSQVQPGDVAIRTDGAGTFILTAADPSVLANWTRLNAPTDAVTSVNGQTGTVVLGYGDVGAASSTDPRLTDQRVPTDGSVTLVKLAFDPATQAELDAEAAARASADAGLQPLDSDLTAIAGLVTTTYGRALLTMADAAAAKTALALAKADVGLGNADNTADSAKPVSTAQATADTTVLSTATGRALAFAVVFGG